MNIFGEFLVRVVAIGVGATLVMDVWNLLLAQLGIKSLNFAYLGRWIGHIPKGVWIHANIASASPVPGELLLGYCAHYTIGVLFAGALVLVCGLGWARSPTLAPALMTGLVTVVAPYLILQPALGLGIASSKAASPGRARIKSLASHIVYGIALYLAARVVAWVV